MTMKVYIPKGPIEKFDMILATQKGVFDSLESGEFELAKCYASYTLCVAETINLKRMQPDHAKHIIELKNLMAKIIRDF